MSAAKHENSESGVTVGAVAQPPSPQGLSEELAASLLAAEGANELPSARPRGLLAIMWGVVSEPMILLLIVAGGIYLSLGELRDSLVLTLSIFVIVGIDLYQQRRTQRALEALRDLSSPRALVIRSGHQRRISGRDVARGDIVLIAEGDRVPADGIVLSCAGLSIDESLLTGESVPTRKRVGNVGDTESRPGGDELPFVYSGTLVVQGHGVIKVTRTGSRTELGRIGKALETIELQETPLRSEVRRVVTVMGLAGFGICALLVIVYGLSRSSWLEGILAGIAVAMSLLPEEFPVVLTVFMALGAWRISRRNVLTRKASAIEALGAATVLCVDKTGTLTRNQMRVHSLFAGGQRWKLDVPNGSIPAKSQELLEYGVLASQRDAFDPIDRAIQDAGEEHLDDSERLHKSWQLVREYPLSPKLLAVTRVWKAPDCSGHLVAIKGAPDALLRLCRLSPTEYDEIKVALDAMAGDGMRILALPNPAIAVPHFPRA